jgi:hypothetical protein
MHGGEAPAAADLHWAHTLAYLFVQERGGDLTNPVVHRAAQAALNTCAGRMTGLHDAGRLDPATHTAVLEHMTTVRGGFAWASRPGILKRAKRCTCGAFQGSPPPQPPSQSSPDQELQDTIRDVATWAARTNPQAAEEWIRDTLAQPGNFPDQMLYFAAGMLANTRVDGNTRATEPQPETGDADLDLAVRTFDTLVAAAGDPDRGSGQSAAADALNALRHADPARHDRRRQIVLQRTLTSLGDFLLDRAQTVARLFLEDGGGHLADPIVRQAAKGAADTFDKFIFANMRTTGRLDENTYLLFVTQIIGANGDFELASRYSS